MKGTLTYLVLLISVACSSPNQGRATQSPDSIKGDSASRAKAKSSPASEPLKIQLFNDVARTQKKLTTVGKGEMRNWHYDGLGWSASSLYEFGSPGIGQLRNNLTLYLESSRQNEVQTLKVKASMPNMNQKSRALTQYASMVEKAFKAIGEPIPDDLTTALRRGKPYTNETPTMSIENRLEDGKYDSWILIVSSY
ncbi:hypothetical protein [Spirosoma utsteinense]|uniref:Lipoprotein n=1 Tax=Spirosoma utsteinense TaxID=2585773 RepID=A0ABR6W7L3_9BACT|nr:hypothetical protein [Spirosoma utsteinense]MBC3789064.1 hypothetical protein [Spirosoma utsteinense]MBC3792133.1 hypothetical protein [Spirosoma utsteinense]